MLAEDQWIRSVKLIQPHVWTPAQGQSVQCSQHQVQPAYRMQHMLVLTVHEAFRAVTGHALPIVCRLDLVVQAIKGPAHAPWAACGDSTCHVHSEPQSGGCCLHYVGWTWYYCIQCPTGPAVCASSGMAQSEPDLEPVYRAGLEWVPHAVRVQDLFPVLHVRHGVVPETHGLDLACRLHVWHPWQRWKVVCQGIWGLYYIRLSLLGQGGKKKIRFPASVIRSWSECKCKSWLWRGRLCIGE